MQSRFSSKRVISTLSSPLLVKELLGLSAAIGNPAVLLLTSDEAVLTARCRTKYLLISGIGKPYDPNTGTDVVGKHFCHQTMSGVNVHFKDRWLNPSLASGPSQTCIDEFNEDIGHGGLGFFGGGYIHSNVTTHRPIGHRLLPPGTLAWGSKCGVIFTSFLVIGFALFLFEVARSLRPGYGATFFFLVIISSYESISNKTVSLAQFAC